MMKPRKTGPLDDEEIRRALEHSGFPLEIRLLNAFHAAGFDPSIGYRYQLGPGEESAEVDLIARARASLAEHKGFVHLTALVEAKRLGERVAFVGLKWNKPDTHAMRAMRIRFSGLPTCQVLKDGPLGHDLTQLMLGSPAEIAKSLDPLNEPEVCPHWVYVRDGKHDFVEADKEDRVRMSFAKLVRATSWLEREHASFLVRNASRPMQLRLELLLPTIVLETPHIYLYDALTGTLEKVPSIIIQEHHEAAGQIHARYIDVTTEGALTQFIERYRRVTSQLGAACDDNMDQLIRIAEMQHEEMQRRSL